MDPQKLVPYPYEAWRDGLFAPDPKASDEGIAVLGATKPRTTSDVPLERLPFLKRLTSKPVWLHRTGLCPQKGATLYYELTDGQIFLWVTRGQLAAKRALVALSDRGFPFLEPKADSLIVYFDACARQLPRKRRAYVGARLGYHETERGNGWLLGKEWIGPTKAKMEVSPVVPDFRVNAFRAEGEFDVWWKRFVQLCREAGVVARWLVYSMFASPLLELVNTRGFVVHHFGRGGSGKSAILDFGMSVYGSVKADPTISGTFNSTAMAMVAQFKDVNHFPLCFDELQAAAFKDRADSINQLVMAIVLGKARQRLTSDGQLQDNNYSWRALVRFTGEQALVGEDSSALEGVANRVLQIEAEALNPKQARDLHEWLERTQICGVAGLRFLEKLVRWVNSAKGRASLVKRSQQIREEVYQSLGDLPDPRVVHIAHVAFTQAMVNMLLGGADWAAAKHGAIRDAVEISKVMGVGRPVSFVEKASAFLQDHIAAHPERYLDVREKEHARRLRTKDYQRLLGVLHPKSNQLVWYIPTEANQLLNRSGFNPGRVWADLDKRSCLRKQQRRAGRGEARVRTVVRQAGLFKSRVYVVSGWPE